MPDEQTNGIVNFSLECFPEDIKITLQLSIIKNIVTTINDSASPSLPMMDEEKQFYGTIKQVEK